MMMDFSGQTAIVTGATRGIGKAISTAFVQKGARVIAIYGTNAAAAEKFIGELGEYHEMIDVYQCNVADAAAVQTLFETIEQKYPSIEILVNNAGIRRDALLALMKDSQWSEVLNVNLTGSFLMAKQAVLLMLKNKYGRIINITSPVARLGFPGQTNYAAAKAGQVAMTRSLAKEVARKKITVNCVSPGFIATDFIDDLDKETLSSYKQLVPVRKFGAPEDVAHGVLFLAHPASSYITGTVLEITGGL